jgi:hypothetical protein
MTSEAKQYGIFLGKFQRSLEAFMKEVVAGFKIGLTPDYKLTKEQLEQRVERMLENRYQERIALERKIGKQYVRSEARRVRKELGLPL